MWHCRMMQPTFDTKQIYRELSGKGLFSKEQAEALTDTLRDVITMNAGNLATKADIAELKGDIEILRSEIGVVRVETKNEIDLLRAGIDTLRAEMKIMQQQLTIRLGSLMVVGIGLLVALQQLG